MSMERFERKYEKKTEPSQDSNFDVNNFLKNKEMNAEAKANGNGLIKPIREDAKGEEIESPMIGRANKKDEGLGESFDQQSEVSDSSLNSTRGNGGQNGYRNPGYEAVPEEESVDKESLQKNDSKEELPLDASKLEDDVSGANGTTAEGQGKKVISKKVSFLWGEASQNPDAENSPEPVSETFVYEEPKDKSLFSLRKFRK